MNIFIVNLQEKIKMSEIDKDKIEKSARWMSQRTWGSFVMTMKSMVSDSKFLEEHNLTEAQREAIKNSNNITIMEFGSYINEKEISKI